MTEAQVRGPGRPRSVQADESIVEATVELLVEDGFDRLSMDAVAARAGVGKATIYRRWPSKEALVIEAVARKTELLPLDEGGSVRDRLVSWLSQVRDTKRTNVGKLMPCMVGASVSNPELGRHYREQIMEPRRARLAAVLREGIATGEVRPDVDVELALDMLVGPLVLRTLMAIDVPDDFPERVVDAAFAGLAPRES